MLLQCKAKLQKITRDASKNLKNGRKRSADSAHKQRTAGRAPRWSLTAEEATLFKAFSLAEPPMRLRYSSTCCTCSSLALPLSGSAFSGSRALSSGLVFFALRAMLRSRLPKNTVVTMFATRNKCIATSNKCLTSSNNVRY